MQTNERGEGRDFLSGKLVEDQLISVENVLNLGNCHLENTVAGFRPDCECSEQGGLRTKVFRNLRAASPGPCINLQRQRVTKG